MYCLTDYSEALVKNLIWITGPARSGTSILGKIISTTKNTEYFFEPELLFSLLPMMSKLSLPEWNLIYKTYLSEELLFNSVVGRKLNFRTIDDSFIKNSFSQKEIEFKLNNQLTSKVLKKYINKKKIKMIIKIPDLINELTMLKKRFKRNKFISTNRNSFDILKSLIKKDWFDQKNIVNNNFPLKIQNGFKYPIWVPKDDVKKWKNYNSQERSAYYIILMKNKIKELKPDYIIDYEKLLESPKNTVLNLCKNLNLDFTKKTAFIIKSIDQKKLYKKRTNPSYNIRKELIERLTI
ncbi:MAG: hypothetical protein CMF94_04935 [Candidatus Marinimicrobia bacterium]|nr:hypothetical protein [Candidatus Neomarinimicrobiota bacterium]